MNAGDLVKVYQKPITLEKFEGEAILIERIPYNMPGFEMWKVHFIGDEVGSTYKRIFYIEEK